MLRSWTWRADIVAVALAVGFIYGAGWWRLRRRDARAAPTWRLALYSAGLAAVLVALLSPVATLGSMSFLMHMGQHELLATIAPPLLLLGNPLTTALWAFPDSIRGAMGRQLAARGMVRRGLETLTFAPVAWPLYVITVWTWHHPAAYQMSLRSELAHDAQHLSFFATALCFWWPIVDPTPHRHPRVHPGIRIAYAVGSVVPGQVLGMIFLLSPRLLYEHYLAAPQLFGWDALGDQAAAGGLMMQMEGMAYLLAVLLVVWGTLSHEERKTRLSDSLHQSEEPEQR